MAKVFQKDTNGTLTNGLLSYWKMDGDSTDFFSTRNGTDTAITYSTGNGKINQGAGFDGTSSKIDFGNTLGFERTDAFSVSFWIKTSTTADTFVIGKGTSVLQHTTPGWAIHVAAGNHVYFTLNSGTSFQNNELQVYDSTIVNDNVWHHIVITYNGNSLASGVAFYQDGVSSAVNIDSNTLTASILNSASCRMGAQANDTNFFPGALDEIGVWNKVLSSTEISDLYNNGNGNTMIIQGGGLMLMGVGA